MADLTETEYLDLRWVKALDICTLFYMQFSWEDDDSRDFEGFLDEQLELGTITKAQLSDSMKCMYSGCEYKENWLALYPG
jgi:hypothetical protein